MKKRKGFTLIELLAVILILGIIALIAIPTVTNIIKESKRGAFKASVQNLISAAETECQLEQMEGEELTTSYSFNDGKVDNDLNVKGDLPKSGTITVDSSCNVTVTVTDGDFCATKTLDSDSVLVGDMKDGECVIDTDSDINKDEEDNNEDDKIEELGVACKRATTLHTEECTSKFYCNKVGYTAEGSKGTTTITYGNLGTTGTLSSGDAFDCDVNNDGTYDPETERFYYVSDYYNTSTKEFETDKAVLIYYSSTSYDSEGNIKPDNSQKTIETYYEPDGYNYLGPTNLMAYLPLRKQWKNPNLITGKRAIVGNGGETSTVGGTLPTAYDYSIYAARLLTSQELEMACGITVGSYTKGELDSCEYLLENTSYSSSSNSPYGHWLETPFADASDLAWYVYAENRGVGNYMLGMYDCNITVRPTITLLKSKMEY